MPAYLQLSEEYLVIRMDYYAKVIHIQEIGDYQYIIDKQEVYYHGIAAVRLLGHPINVHKKILELIIKREPMHLDLSFIYKGCVHKRWAWIELERDPAWLIKGSVAVIQAHKVIK